LYRYVFNHPTYEWDPTGKDTAGAVGGTIEGTATGVGIGISVGLLLTLGNPIGGILGGMLGGTLAGYYGYNQGKNQQGFFNGVNAAANLTTMKWGIYGGSIGAGIYWMGRLMTVMFSKAGQIIQKGGLNETGLAFEQQMAIESNPEIAALMQQEESMQVQLAQLNEFLELNGGELTLEEAAQLVGERTALEGQLQLIEGIIQEILGI
jgi:hypothetical protein